MNSSDIKSAVHKKHWILFIKTENSLIWNLNWVKRTLRDNVTKIKPKLKMSFTWNNQINRATFSIKIPISLLVKLMIVKIKNNLNDILIWKSSIANIKNNLRTFYIKKLLLHHWNHSNKLSKNVNLKVLLTKQFNKAKLWENIELNRKNNCVR